MPTPQPIAKTSIITTLTDLGLNENEAKLYEILLNTPDATIPALKQKSPWSRTMLYYILEQLEGYELIEKKEMPGKSGAGTKTVYNAAAPEKLEAMFSEQEKELRRQKQALGQVIGDLRSAYNLAHNKPGVKFFEGKAGVISAYEELLKIKQPILSIEDKGNMVEFIPEYVKDYVRKRVQNKIPNRAIAPDTNTLNTPDPGKYLDSRLLPAADFPFYMDIKICQDTIQLATLKEGQAVAVHIIHPIIADNFKILFEYIWKQAGLQPKYKITPPTVSSVEPASLPPID